MQLTPAVRGLEQPSRRKAVVFRDPPYLALGPWRRRTQGRRDVVEVRRCLRRPRLRRARLRRGQSPSRAEHDGHRDERRQTRPNSKHAAGAYRSTSHLTPLHNRSGFRQPPARGLLLSYPGVVTRRPPREPIDPHISTTRYATQNAIVKLIPTDAAHARSTAIRSAQTSWSL